MRKSRPDGNESEIHFQHQNDSLALQQGQRKGSRRVVTPVTGEKYALNGH
jgi:hypothetical protein